MTHYSSAFLRPPVPLLAHLIIFSAYPIVLICLRERTRKGDIPAFSLCVERPPYCQEVLENKWLKWDPSICSFLIQRAGGECRGQERTLTPFLTLGLGPSASLWVSNHLKKVLESWAPSGPPAKRKCLCYYTQEPLKQRAQFRHLHIPASWYPSQNIHRRPCLIQALDLECKLQGEICTIWNLSNFPINYCVTPGKN